LEFDDMIAVAMDVRGDFVAGFAAMYGGAFFPVVKSVDGDTTKATEFGQWMWFECDCVPGP
jgi:hypothetical protein